MIRKLLVLVALTITAHAYANDYNVQLGQSISLQAGDVALVRLGNSMSAVSCAGGTTNLPPRFEFQVDRWARFSDIFQNGPDISRTIQCSAYSGEQQIQQAKNDALNAAREACFAAGYSYCRQPVVTDEQFGFYVQGNAPGSYQCEVVARIVGTMN